MPQLNSQYTFEDFNAAFPTGEMVTHTNGNSIPRYNRVWSYSNKVLMCISEPRERDDDKEIDAYTQLIWVMFMRRPELNLYWNLYSADTSEDVIKCSERHFTPPIPAVTVSAKDSALDLIEVNVVAALKETDFEAKREELVKLLVSKKAKSNPVRMKEIQEKLENLKPILIEEVLNKSACSYSYYSGGSWHAYYPEPSTLATFHIKNNKEVDQKYLGFLSGEKFKELRTLWSEIDTITPGE